jgi:hypothetical protein
VGAAGRLLERIASLRLPFAFDLRSAHNAIAAMLALMPVNDCSRNIPMFLKHGMKHVNEIEMVAPTGFDGFCIAELRGMIRAA